MRALHVFVDETKHVGYLLVAAKILDEELQILRKAVRDLVLPGQRRLHMKDERNQRKRAIAAALVGAGTQATVDDAARRYPTEREARAACLRALVHDLASARSVSIVLEQDDSLVRWDNQRLVEIVRATGCRDRVRYEHSKASAEQLLAVPDAIAWCWAKGGDWRRRIAPAVAVVRAV